ncbi:hypothetical protein [Sutcliffiella rhizosphaerae]|uniref:Uncharacterized protein n=1 Tax=Sutcliffiella rhizosphaerae TaxID=2880967 RepID=A0ABM8YNF2_9BACI|nr:hypothetical protein [Sutcliffiella rhizosphaerae]CAG9621388.1 hypothetical protein BACCIP111883_02161 [Sutcliffiella rhizosphaerae]
MGKFTLGPKMRKFINFIFFSLSLLFLIYNISIIGFFYLLITFGESQGTLIYSLISVAGLFLVLVPLVFRLTTQRFYHFALLVLHLFASLLPFIMKNMSVIFDKVL